MAARHLFRPRKLLIERVGGIGPPSRAWKARSLPLSYTRIDYSRHNGTRTRTWGLCPPCCRLHHASQPGSDPDRS